MNDIEGVEVRTVSVRRDVFAIRKIVFILKKKFSTYFTYIYLSGSLISEKRSLAILSQHEPLDRIE